jgi:hypothetical protein
MTVSALKLRGMVREAIILVGQANKVQPADSIVWQMGGEVMLTKETSRERHLLIGRPLVESWLRQDTGSGLYFRCHLDSMEINKYVVLLQIRYRRNDSIRFCWKHLIHQFLGHWIS